MEAIFVEDYQPRSISLPPPLKKPSKTGFESIIEQGRKNAKCEVDYPAEEDSYTETPLIYEDKEIKTIDFDNSIASTNEVFINSKKISEMLNLNIKSIQNIPENLESEEIKYPIYEYRQKIKDYGKRIKALTYLTICQMYTGVLIEEKLTLKKGKAYEYKHQHEIGLNNFFELIISNKEQVYKVLGYNNSILIEELITRLFNLGFFKVEEYKEEESYYDRDEQLWKSKKSNKTRYFLDDDARIRTYKSYNDKEPYDYYDDEVLRLELFNIEGVLVKFKEPLIIIDRTGKYYTGYKILRVKAFDISEKKGINFIGGEEGEEGEEEDYGNESRFELSYKMYNYLYKLNKELIDEILSKAIKRLKMKLFERESNYKEVQNKCQKYMLAAKMIGVNIEEIYQRC